MWKPGKKKPQNATTVFQTSGKNIKEPESKVSSVDTKSKSPRKTLSGATLNMKFMQRKQQQQQQQQRQNPSEHKIVLAKDDQHVHDMDVDSIQVVGTQAESRHDASYLEMNSMNDLVLPKMHISALPRSQIVRSDYFDSATPCDIYGQLNVQVVGRRSFGGFNPIVENMRKVSIQTSKNEDKNNTISDQELLERFQKFVEKGRRNDASIDTGRSVIHAIGNQATKRRNSHNSGHASGRTKQKRRRS
jgi:hypothetical protein